MRLVKLELSSFRSFIIERYLEFPDKAGFYLMRGENKVNLDLGGNDTGKSTTWDALCWCLFGKTARGLRASNIASWQDSLETTRVSATFEIRSGLVPGVARKYKHSKLFTICRTHAPNSLTITNYGTVLSENTGEALTQEKLEEIIGMNYSSFLHTTLLGQFSKFFFDLSPTDKLAIFVDVLNLSCWVDASNKAKKRTQFLKDEYTRGEKELSSLAGELEATLTHLKKAKEDQQSHKKSSEEDKNKTREAILSKQKEKAELEEYLENLEKTLAKIEKSLEENEKTIAPWNDKADKFTSQLIGIEKELIVIDKEADKIKDKIEKVINEKKCARCGQEISEKMQSDMVADLKEELRSSEKERKSLVNTAKAKVEKSEEVAAHLKENIASQEQIKDKYRKKKKFYDENERGLIQIDAAITQLEKELKNLEKENPFDSTVKNLNKAIAKTKQEIEIVESALGKIGREQISTEFWIKGFKELRLWLVDSALRELEVNVNNSMLELGLDGWRVEFDIERETKSGGVSKGFIVLVHSPESTTSNGVAPFESWGGGVTQRLRIAGEVGLAEMIRSRQGVSFDLEVWDEVSTHLSVEGVEDMLDFFAERVRKTRRQIWLVDHNNLIGDFDGRLVVSKDITGSQYRYEESNFCIEKTQKRRRQLTD
jgi:DNA repair exonuclease SbcCD ATPase subunit